MSDTTGISLEIMGKIYHIKCPQTEVESLKKAAQYFDEKINKFKENTSLSPEKLAVITALNITHQLLCLEQSQATQITGVNQRLAELHDTIEKALIPHFTLEFASAE